MSTTNKRTRASRRAAPLCSALPGQNKNPLFIEFYPHTKCDCYKINLPWTKYHCHTLVLCDVSKGLAHAQRIARRAIAEHLDCALAEAVAAYNRSANNRVSGPQPAQETP